LPAASALTNEPGWKAPAASTITSEGAKAAANAGLVVSAVWLTDTAKGPSGPALSLTFQPLGVIPVFRTNTRPIGSWTFVALFCVFTFKLNGSVDPNGIMIN
jgi:hypothetical protein